MTSKAVMHVLVAPHLTIEHFMNYPITYISDSESIPCAGDDWECYRPAQLALVHTIARHMDKSRGCYIIVTGDYHIADIKVPESPSLHDLGRRS